MFDVLPPTPRRTTPPHPRRRSTASRPVQKNAASITPGPRVVTLHWRLPARLRRPIRQELARARQQKQREQTIVRFERRPLYSQLPDTHPAYGSMPPAPASSVAAEQHTADVYKNSRPNLALAVPPYRGRAARPPVAVSRPRTATMAERVPPAPPVRAAGHLPRPHRQLTAIPGLGDNVRDVPYTWQTPSRLENAASTTVSLTEAQKILRPIQQPKRRLALPLHLSVFPWRRSRADAAPDKKKL